MLSVLLSVLPVSAEEVVAGAVDSVFGTAETADDVFPSSPDEVSGSLVSEVTVCPEVSEDAEVLSEDAPLSPAHPASKMHSIRQITAVIYVFIIIFPDRAVPHFRSAPPCFLLSAAKIVIVGGYSSRAA